MQRNVMTSDTKTDQHMSMPHSRQINDRISGDCSYIGMLATGRNGSFVVIGNRFLMLIGVNINNGDAFNPKGVNQYLLLSSYQNRLYQFNLRRILLISYEIILGPGKFSMLISLISW